MRFRLDSHGSTVESTTSSAASTPSSAASFFSSPSPMPFDLLPSPASASSTTSFFADECPPVDLEQFQHDSGRLSPAADDTDAGVDPSADWRQVGRDLRGIADHFASTRRRQVTKTHQTPPSEQLLIDCLMVLGLVWLSVVATLRLVARRPSGRPPGVRHCGLPLVEARPASERMSSVSATPTRVFHHTNARFIFVISFVTV